MGLNGWGSMATEYWFHLTAKGIHASPINLPGKHSPQWIVVMGFPNILNTVESVFICLQCMKQSNNPLAVQYNKGNHALSRKEGGVLNPLCATHMQWAIKVIVFQTLVKLSEGQGRGDRLWKTAAMRKRRVAADMCFQHNFPLLLVKSSKQSHWRFCFAGNAPRQTACQDLRPHLWYLAFGLGCWGFKKVICRGPIDLLLCLVGMDWTRGISAPAQWLHLISGHNQTTWPGIVMSQRLTMTCALSCCVALDLLWLLIQNNK